MVTAKNSKAILSFLLILSFMFGLTVPALAAEGVTQTDGISIKLKVGSAQMTVNGNPVAITAPFQKDGTTFVPLSVITKSFGASLQLKDNKVITLKYLTHTIVLTIGSKTAWVDGQKSALVSAPVVVKGVTMVPLRVVQAFGATVTPNAATKEIVISVATSSSAGTGSGGSASGIDSDAGKTKIGDSYYGWTMNYPTGLVQSYQSANGDSLEFRDVAKDYYLAILVEEATNALSSSEVKEEMLSYFFEKETLISYEPAIQTGEDYSKAVSKDSTTGYFYQYRSFQANEKLYTVVFGKKTTSAAELEKEVGILNSFRTTFDPKDEKVKDLTAVADGQIAFEHDDYGMSVELPVDWWKDEDAGAYPFYYSGDQDAYLYAKVTSLVSGDTLEKWVDRRVERLKHLFDTPFYKEIERKNVTWNGQPAILLKISYSNDTKNWSDEYQLFSLAGNHRFYAEFSYFQTKKSEYEPMAEKVLDSIRIDPAVIDENIGYIEDSTDILDATATTSKTSKKFAFSVTLPQHWTGTSKDFEGGNVQYNDYGTTFSITVIEQPADLSAAYQSVQSLVQNKQQTAAGFKMIENGNVTIAGKSGKRIVYEEELNGTPYRNILTMVDHNGNLFIIEQIYDLANGSAFNLDLLNKAAQSIQFQ
ncbi:stalk domain-containing protein [Cohnella thailandensis]|uniref:Copper amine oxidase-like N-terminal domain-containing protein n=1 Tax=Cohnella thailandensis TaxID=557557 RepID=A0A841SJ10_9BACL|nr:stalk domain-containing protein [Cohnella thailandensis]MBB6632513.1 hypothetical protein [Cohnella thailandensis]MBP1971805.1 hypothetical protein [Cohnella thailandensis]